MTPAALPDGDDLITGRMFVAIDDGELILLAAWWREQDSGNVMVSTVVDVRDCLN